jgi:hypothetical protein
MILWLDTDQVVEIPLRIYLAQSEQMEVWEEMTAEKRLDWVTPKHSHLVRSLDFILSTVGIFQAGLLQRKCSYFFVCSFALFLFYFFLLFY